MEHTKKLILMEPKLIRPTIKDKTLSKLDDEISTILNSDVSDDVKAKNYSTTLRRYRAFDHEPVSKPIDSIDALQTDILKFVPVTQQHKANRLLSLLKKDPDVSITNDRSLVYKQNVIPESDITELIANVLNKSSSYPSGWKELASSLKRSNAPKNLISDENTWKYMHPPPPKASSRRVGKRAKRAKVNWEEY